MGLFFTSFIILIVSLKANTSECNYVVDYFWTSVSRPTAAPSDAPSPSPTDAPTPAPTISPTKSPFAAADTVHPVPSPTDTGIEIMITTRQEKNDGSVISYDWDADEALLKPMTFDYCYSFPNNKFYFGDFSLKYQCSSNNLVRKIYYNTLECDSANPDMITVQNWEMGQYNIRYVCNQPENCEFTKLINTTAITPAPTPAPTNNPTRSPTPGPTMSPTGTPIHTGTMYPSARPTLNGVNMITTQGYTNENGWGGDDEEWWEKCDGITASDSNSESDRIISYFGERICVKASHFEDVFYGDYGENEHFGWYCDTNNKKYFMGLFRDSICTDMRYKMIEYTNDKCIPKEATNEYYTAYWTYVECAVSDETSAFTPSPNEPQSPATMPGMSPSDPQGNDAVCVRMMYTIVFIVVVQFML